MSLRAGTVGLIGTGMIGSSILMGLRERGWFDRAYGFDTDVQHLDAAKRSGVIDRETQSLEEIGAESDLIILAVPVRSTEEVCRRLAHALTGREHVTLTDVGSVKGDVIRTVKQNLIRPDRFVPGHPIAGTERSGPTAASATLFAGRRVVLTPEKQTQDDSVELCRDMWQALGAQVYFMTPELHDQIFSLVSHLPHVSAFALAAAVAKVCEREPELAQAVPGFFGGGFVDSTRIAASNPAMWRDILLTNSTSVRAHLKLLRDTLDQLDAALLAGNGDELEEIIDRAHQGRAQVLAEGRQ